MESFSCAERERQRGGIEKIAYTKEVQRVRAHRRERGSERAKRDGEREAIKASEKPSRSVGFAATAGARERKIDARSGSKYKCVIKSCASSCPFCKNVDCI